MHEILMQHGYEKWLYLYTHEKQSASRIHAKKYEHISQLVAIWFGFVPELARNRWNNQEEYDEYTICIPMCL